MSNGERKIKAKVEKITSAHLLSLSARGFRILKSNFDNHDWLTSEGGIHPMYFCQKSSNPITWVPFPRILTMSKSSFVISLSLDLSPAYY